jgi:hypothetical protein
MVPVTNNQKNIMFSGMSINPSQLFYGENMGKLPE